MPEHQNKFASDLYRKIKWLIFFRALFATVLLCTSLFVGYNERLPFFKPPLIFLYGISIGFLFFSGIYLLILRKIANLSRFGYLQLIIDVFLVSLIIVLTGGFTSVFSFLYLIVIIYASMITFRKGAMIIATICCIQYGLLVDLEYYGIIHPYGFDSRHILISYSWNYVIYKLIITITVCFAVAALSGYLSEQERRARQDLWAMEDQVKRVEKLAAVGEMASGLAHEIKNPLAALSGSIQVLREDLPYEKGRDRLMEIVLRETDRISALVNNFLMFAKPKPGNAQAISLSKAIDDILDLFQTDARRNRSVAISRDLIDDVYISIDPDQLRQILWNLMLNAEEAIEREGSIRVSMHPEDKKYAGVTISDTGCGMTEDTIRSIFDPFFTRKPKGTGLGLSIVQRLISSSNGFIDVTSVPGKGSSFTVKFPRIPHPRSSSS
ncbi:MAG: ATP-binding protein [Desulfobacterales bacterium]|jgi:two-component system sensor histidine kinase PilS (NtrC family)|nr:ATP-binding protein [Desulfobacterales bacterium]